MEKNYKIEVTKKILNFGLRFLIFMIIPLNIIIYFALTHSSCLIIRLLPMFLSLGPLVLYFFKGNNIILLKLKILIVFLFLAGVYTLLLGLLDMASLWFILAIIFALLDSFKKLALMLFFVSLTLMLAAGVLMFFKNPYIPIDYGFENCQFACIGIRIINFLIIGFLIFKILRMFIETISLYIEEITHKNIILEKLRITELKEAEQNFANEMLKKDYEQKQREIDLKHKELNEAIYKNIKFNTMLNSIKQFVKEKDFNHAIQAISLNQSNYFGYEGFLQKFNELYPEFTKKIALSFPQLTETDLKISVLIFAGLKSVEIAEMLNISDVSVAKYRNRLRKKLDLEPNADIALYLKMKLIN